MFDETSINIVYFQQIINRVGCFLNNKPMKLKNLYLKNFGPFNEYVVEFPTTDAACILLTGKNNAGKTTIIRALKFINNALRFARGSSKSFKRELLKKDLPSTNLQRFIYRFKDEQAEIQATFDNDKVVTVILDGSRDTVTVDVPAYSHSMSDLFGFLPPLGQLLEEEQLLTNRNVLNYLDTTTAPHHLRNHLYHLINVDQYRLIKQIIKNSWQGIELQNCTHDIPTNLLTCIYKDGDFYYEIAWSGQGLQIWLQIVTHLVRLSDHPILVFDEPEIFLHPQKQHGLIELVHDYYSGCALIATHSSELISNVDISHIIFINKDLEKSTLRKASDRNALEKIRRSIGSSFNLYASQFEDVESLIATEHQLYYEIIQSLASQCGYTKKTQLIKLSGFTRWKDSINYRNSYSMFFGKDIECAVLLDRDYYPQEYLDSITNQLKAFHIKATFTPGKEIENLFLEEDFLTSLLPDSANASSLSEFLDSIYKHDKEICKSKYAEFAKEYCEQNKHKTYSTILSKISPMFEQIWEDKSNRHNLIHGKNTLAEVRDFFREQYKLNLTTHFLIEKLVLKRKVFVKHFLSQIY